MNHLLIVCHPYRIFEILSNQFLSELKKEDVLVSFLKCAVLSESHVAIRKFPEFLGELEP
jgi:hypothetical protein